MLDWTIDIWLPPHNYSGPRFMDLVEPMLAVMTPEIRMTIPRLKDHVQDHPTVAGVDLPRAVIDGDVRSPDAFEQWGAMNEDLGLTDWRPRP